MNYFQYLDELKVRPPHLEFLPYPDDLIEKGMRAWRQSFFELGPFKWDVVLPENDDEKQKFLWSKAKFNLERFKTLMGAATPSGFFHDLVKSGMIFPDGTARIGIFSTGFLPKKGG